MALTQVQRTNPVLLSIYCYYHMGRGGIRIAVLLEPVVLILLLCAPSSALCNLVLQLAQTKPQLNTVHAV